ncbi:SubName: Full=Uncharacterized protein {ECO:0000313/EMBL:CCA71733.1} [Serendipita indica DSM 11827]|nr:SubName: Full=Uncharacterized protein {ECO:0000313/EMBL:CCA71733.1} [Serendipita indica DSM 11827]
MSAVIKSLRPDPDVDLKNTVEYASICLDCLYKLPQAAAAQRVGTNSDQRRVREHRHTFEQQLETFVSTLKDCYVFADNVGMLRDNLDTASAKEVRSVVEEMAVAGERIHSQVLASIARLHQYSQTSPYDTVWPMTAKNDANEAALDGPMLRTQFRNAIQGLLTSFNHISEFWNDQAVALKTSLNGKDGEFGLTADQAITLADRWARHSPIIMETVHSLVKICDALTVEPELRQGSQRQTSFSTTFTSRTPEQRKYTPRLIGESPNSLPEADQSSQGSRPSAGSEGSRPNKAPTAISGNRKL